MNGAGLDFGSLNDVLGNADPYRNVIGWLESEDEFRKQHPDVVDELHKADPTGKVNLMRSAGPISDRYILSAAPASLIIGAASTSLLSGRLSVTAKTPSRPKFLPLHCRGGRLAYGVAPIGKTVTPGASQALASSCGTADGEADGPGHSAGETDTGGGGVPPCSI